MMSGTDPTQSDRGGKQTQPHEPEQIKKTGNIRLQV